MSGQFPILRQILQQNDIVWWTIYWIESFFLFIHRHDCNEGFVDKISHYISDNENITIFNVFDKMCGDQGDINCDDCRLIYDYWDLIRGKCDNKQVSNYLNKVLFKNFTKGLDYLFISKLNKNDARTMLSFIADMLVACYEHWDLFDQNEINLFKLRRQTVCEQPHIISCEDYLSLLNKEPFGMVLGMFLYDFEIQNIITNNNLQKFENYYIRLYYVGKEYGLISFVPYSLYDALVMSSDWFQFNMVYSPNDVHGRWHNTDSITNFSALYVYHNITESLRGSAYREIWQTTKNYRNHGFTAIDYIEAFLKMFLSPNTYSENIVIPKKFIRANGGDEKINNFADSQIILVIVIILVFLWFMCKKHYFAVSSNLTYNRNGRGFKQNAFACRSKFE